MGNLLYVAVHLFIQSLYVAARIAAIYRADHSISTTLSTRTKVTKANYHLRMLCLVFLLICCFPLVLRALLMLGMGIALFNEPHIPSEFKSNHHILRPLSLCLI